MSKNDFEHVSGKWYYGIIFTPNMATGVVQYTVIQLRVVVLLH